MPDKPTNWQAKLDPFRHAALSLWWGGLTFYAGFVVPIGSRVTDTTTQGFVTQRVTVWLNVLALLTVALFGPTLKRERWRVRLSWGVVAISLPFAFWVHVSLSRMLDLETQSVLADANVFYQRHQVYLWLTVAQWLGGLMLLPRSDRQPVASAESSK